MDQLKPGTEACPYCRCRGEMRIHGYYDRSLIEFIDGRPVKVSLCVCRLICRQCKKLSSHAVLPDPVIPYCRHSLFFILRVLAEHALRLRSVEKICEIFDISTKTFFRWQKLFVDHRREWQGLLTSMEMSLKEAILELIQFDPFCDFASSFFRLTGIALLQSHKNPSRLLRKAGFPDSDFP